MQLLVPRIFDISLPALALVSGVTVVLLALTEMDGGYLFRRALSDAAPIRGTLVEISWNFKSGFQPEGKGQCTWSQTGGIFKNTQLGMPDAEISHDHLSFPCPYHATLAPVAMVKCSSPAQMPLTPEMDQRIQVSWNLDYILQFCTALFRFCQHSSTFWPSALDSGTSLSTS